MINKYQKLFSRAFSTQKSVPANLAFLYQPCTQPSLPDPKNLIVLHGVLGSSKNFRGITQNRKISSKVNTYLLDLRNHGKSEHRDTMTYEEMASDVHEFLLQNELLEDDNILLGHSMGGRVAMEFAVRYPDVTKAAIIVDIAPYNYFKDERFDFMYQMYDMLQRLTKVELSNKEISELRKEIISESISPDVGEVVASNLVPDGKGGYQWRINLDALSKNLKTQVLQLEYTGTTKYKGPVRIICGDQSEYTSKDIVYSYKSVFENLDEEKDVFFLNSGHWVHYFQPHKFIDLVSEFLDQVETK